MTSKTSLKWMGGMQFDADVNGHRITLDATPEFGGAGKGTTPKPLMLTALAGCTGMDVVSLLAKMRVENYQLQLEVEGEQTEDYPVVYHTIHLNYRFIGEKILPTSVLRAVELSQTRYCGVYAMLSKSAQILTKVFINDEEIA